MNNSNTKNSNNNSKKKGFGDGNKQESSDPTVSSSGIRSSTSIISVTIPNTTIITN